MARGARRVGSRVMAAPPITENRRRAGVSRPHSEPSSARPHASSPPGRPTRPGRRPRIAPIRSRSSSAKPPTASRIWCRLRYARMGASAFTFYRGGAAIMAADLAPTPVSGFWVQACGDAHLSNFGAFASPRRDLVVDINDFDETLPGPWEWDLKRLAAARDRRPRPRLRPQAATGDRDRRRPRVPDGDAPPGGAHQPRHLVPAGRAGDAARADVPGRRASGS